MITSGLPSHRTKLSLPAESHSDAQDAADAKDAQDAQVFAQPSIRGKNASVLGGALKRDAILLSGDRPHHRSAGLKSMPMSMARLKPC